MRLTAWASALPLSLLQWQFEPTLSPPRASLALPFPLSHGSPSKGAECRQSLVNSPMGNLPVLFLGLVPRQCPPKAKRKSRRHSGVKRKRVLLNVTHHIIWTRLWRSIPLRSPSSLRDNRGPASEEWTVGGLELPFSSFSGRSSGPFPLFPLVACLLSHQSVYPRLSGTQGDQLILDDHPVDAIMVGAIHLHLRVYFV